MARYPGHRRVLHAAVALGALGGNSDTTEQASRLLQMLPKRPIAGDVDGRLARSQAEEDLWATHLALRAAGAPASLSMRVLSKAVHLFPSSTRSWARLGAMAADSTALVEPPAASSSHAAPVDTLGSKLADACVSAAEKQPLFALLAKARGSVGAGAGGGDAGDFSAREVVGALLGFGKATRSGGKAAGGKAGTAASRVAKACARAVHLYPTETRAWRLLAASLASVLKEVDEAFSSSESAETRDLLGHVQVIYAGISNNYSESKNPPPRVGDKDQNVSLSALEADCCGLLLAADQHSATAVATRWEEKHASSGFSTGGSPDEVSFATRLMAARVALCRGQADAIGGYKLALRAQPKTLVGLRELSACYELSDQHHASVSALECGARTASAGKERGSPSAAPLHLQIVTRKFSTQQAEEGLQRVADAFRSGKGGVGGHVMHGLLNLRLRKGSLATNALARAKEADPAVTDFVDILPTTNSR